MNKLNLFRYFKRYSFLYLIALIAMTAGTMLDQAAPLIVQHIIDDVLIAKRMEALNFLLLGILGIGVGRCIFQYTKEYACDYAGSKIASEVRINLFQKIQSLSANFFDGINSGELMSRVKDDVDRIWDIAAFMGILMAEVFIRTVTTIIFMVRINWQLALIPIVGMIGSGVIAIMMEKQLDDLYGAVMQEGSEMNNTAAENLAGVRTVKAFAREGFEIAKFHKHNQKFYELNIDLSRFFVKYNPMIQTIKMESLSAFMSNIKYGMFILDGEWNILPQYSAITPKLLGCPNPENYNFLLLMARTISREKALLLKDFLERLYEPEFKESAIASMNPIRTLKASIRVSSLKEPGKTDIAHKTLNFEFKRLYNRQHTKVINIVVSVQILGNK